MAEQAKHEDLEQEAVSTTDDDSQNGAGRETAEDLTHGAGEDHDPEQDWLAEVKALQADLERHREALLRNQAEMENQRKRLAREAERARKFALENFIRDLLPVHDSLERGLEASGDAVTVESLREGKALTLKMLLKALEEHGLELVDPTGEAFDPERHEAMTTQPSDEVAPGVVLQVLQKGFMLHDRVIRPAMVIVSRAAD